MVWLKLSLHRQRGDLGLTDKPKFECIILKKYWYLTLNKLANRLVVKIFDFLPRDSFLYILFLRDISMEVGHFKKEAWFFVLLKSLLISHWPLLISHWPFLISHLPLLISHWPLLISHWPFLSSYRLWCEYC